MRLFNTLATCLICTSAFSQAPPPNAAMPAPNAAALQQGRQPGINPYPGVTVTERSRVRAFNASPDGQIRSIYLSNGSVADLSGFGPQFGSQLRKGERIRLTGTRTSVNGQSIVVPQQITVGQQTYSAVANPGFPGQLGGFNRGGQPGAPGRRAGAPPAPPVGGPAMPRPMAGGPGAPPPPPPMAGGHGAPPPPPLAGGHGAPPRPMAGGPGAPPPPHRGQDRPDRAGAAPGPDNAQRPGDGNRMPVPPPVNNAPAPTGGAQAQPLAAPAGSPDNGAGVPQQPAVSPNQTPNQ